MEVCDNTGQRATVAVDLSAEAATAGSVSTECGPEPIVAAGTVLRLTTNAEGASGPLVEIEGLAAGQGTVANTFVPGAIMPVQIMGADSVSDLTFSMFAAPIGEYGSVSVTPVLNDGLEACSSLFPLEVRSETPSVCLLSNAYADDSAVISATAERSFQIKFLTAETCRFTVQLGSLVRESTTQATP